MPISMRKQRMTREESRAQTRARLLDAARKVFVRDGFRQASIEQIAEDAGYTIGALYSNFASKGDLFVAVFEEYVAERAREIEAAVASAEGPGRRTAAAAEQWMDRLATDPEWFAVFLEFCAYSAQDPELRRQFAVPLGAVRVAIGRLITVHAQETGADLMLPAEEIATAVKALGNGLALERLIDPDSVSDTLFGRALEIFFRGLQSTEAASTRSRRSNR
jgi:AcrR family transcriptional regulator